MFNYQDININYIIENPKNEKTVVLLHGWGQNIEMMKPITKKLSKKYRYLIIDLPGHGKSEEPKSIWTLEEFTKLLHQLLTSLEIKNPILVGHSFGGKIALLYSSIYKVDKLVLLASPYKASTQKPGVALNLAKKLEFIPGVKQLKEQLKKHIGSTDYKNASKTMRDILVKHINTDLKNEASKIKCPTLIVWGTNDEAVPVSDAYELEKIIDNAGTVIYEGATHYAYLERIDNLVKVLEVFI